MQIILRLLVIGIIAGITGWLIGYGAVWFLIALAAVFFLIQVIGLIRYLNKVNDKISYFFEAVKNNDFSMNLVAHKRDHVLRKLNENMEAVNRKIQKIYVEAEQKEKYFHVLIESVKIGIVTFDESGFVVDANKAFLSCVGLEQFTHMDQLKRLDEHLHTALINIPCPGSQLVTFTTSSGKMNVSVRSGKFLQEGRLLKLLTVQEINQELDEKELDSWMRLIRVLTHEIMNSIAPVTSLADTLFDFFSKDGKPIRVSEVDEKVIATTVRGLDVIREQGKGLIHFVELYRTFTRLPKPEKETIDLRQLIDRIILLNKNSIEEAGIYLNFQMSSDVKLLTIDPKLISQVLINLLKNGVEALQNTENPQISIVIKRENERTVIHVKNNGPQIPSQIMDEIFVPFFTTKSSGNGIGLSLSRQIMRLHGGSLKVKSDSSETVFTLVFDS